MPFVEFFRIQESLPPVSSETVFSLGSFPVTNSFLFILFIAIIFAFGGYYIARSFQVVPRGAQSIVELLYEGIVLLVSSITGSTTQAKVIFPVVATLIIYIGVANIIGFIPGLTSIEYAKTSIFRAPMSDFNTTFGLAFALIVIINFLSIKDFGLFGYLGRFFQFKQLIAGFRKGIGSGVTAFVEFLVGLLDIVSEGAKIISLSFRLFGNIFAGEVLAVILLGSIAYVVPSLWMAMSMLFGAIQALVFGALIAAYYSSSVRAEASKQGSR